MYSTLKIYVSVFIMQLIYIIRIVDLMDQTDSRKLSESETLHRNFPPIYYHENRYVYMS